MQKFCFISTRNCLSVFLAYIVLVPLLSQTNTNRSPVIRREIIFHDLNPPKIEKDYNFYNSVKDITSYLPFETSISHNLGYYYYDAFLKDGTHIRYSIKGERKLFEKCSGEICYTITNRNFLGISNYGTEWAKGDYYNEEEFKTKSGNTAAFIVTERDFYIYNGYTNQWIDFSLDGERILGVANKNELAAVVTDRRIIGIYLPDQKMQELSILLFRMHRFEIKENLIHFYGGGYLYRYDPFKDGIETISIWR